MELKVQEKINEQSPILEIVEEKIVVPQSSEEKDQKDKHQEISEFEAVQNNSNRKRGRSSHAINPSPRIQTSSSEKKLGVALTGSRHQTFVRMASNQSLQRVESQERKRFIDVVSKGENAIRSTYIHMKPGGCC